jgi:hypothetical protein
MQLGAAGATIIAIDEVNAGAALKTLTAQFCAGLRFVSHSSLTILFAMILWMRASSLTVQGFKSNPIRV